MAEGHSVHHSLKQAKINPKHPRQSAQQNKTETQSTTPASKTAFRKSTQNTEHALEENKSRDQSAQREQPRTQVYSTNLLLKSCPSHILSVILSLFNALLKNGHLPTNWKHSKIIMIAKKNMPKDSFSSYRPISLISCLSKCLEKIMNVKLILWAEQNSILPDCQAGLKERKTAAKTTCSG